MPFRIRIEIILKSVGLFLVFFSPSDIWGLIIRDFLSVFWISRRVLGTRTAAYRIQSPWPTERMDTNSTMSQPETLCVSTMMCIKNK